MQPSTPLTISSAGAGVVIASSAVAAVAVGVSLNEFPQLHTVLDTGAAVLSGVLAALFTDLARRFKHPFSQRVAVSFGVTAVLELIHVLVSVEGLTGALHVGLPAAVRPATWGPSAFVLALGLGFALATLEDEDNQKHNGPLPLGFVLLTAGTLIGWLFYKLPRYTSPSILGITRPTLIGVPLIWAFVAWYAWRVRGSRRLPPSIVFASLVLAIGHVFMLYSSSTNDAFAMVAHLGKISAYLVLLLGVFAIAAVDMAARVEAEKALENANRDLERRINERTAELATSEHRFRALIENSADGIALISAAGQVVYLSAAANRLIGAQETVTPMNYLDRVHPNDAPMVRDLMTSVLSEPHSSRTFRARVWHDGGTWRNFEVTLTNLLDIPYLGAVIANFRDITDRVDAETSAREHADRFREMADHIREAYSVVELLTNRIAYVSPVWAEIWGRPISQGSERAVWVESVHADDRAKFESLQTNGERGNRAEAVFRIRRPDNAIRWVRGRCFPVRDNTGQVYRLVGVYEDITDLRNTEAQFQQAQRMEAVGRLAGGVAHDFNNLLTVILGDVHLLIDMLEQPDAKRLAGDIRDAADSASVLTRQLLAFSRRQVVEPVVCQLNDAVAEVAKLLRRVIGEDVKLELSLGADTGAVRVDRGQLEQVLTNLAVNARDAMPKGGLLAIKTSFAHLSEEYAATQSEVKAGDYALITVSDNGTGMSREVLQHIFEPFFTTKELGKGTGLGLATCYGIIKQSGGHISAYSEVGVGTTFRIYLPVAHEHVPTPSSNSAVTPTRGTETILVVEDDSAVRRVAATALRRLGYTVHEARDGLEATQLARTHGADIDMLFTDVVMPGMGGRELADRMREMIPEARILFTSGYTDDAVLREQLIEQNAELLEKPYTHQTLGAKVREILDRETAEADGDGAGT